MPDDRGKPWITYALIAMNAAAFVFEIASGASPISPTPQQMIELGGSYPPLTLNGEWWRLGSSMFLHFGVLHIGLNMVCLYQARVVEQLFGRLGFVVIYLLAGLGGGIASLVASPHGVAAGASGAVFGVYGAFGAFLVVRRSRIEAEAWRRTTRSIGRFLLLNLVIGLAATGISLSAHAGGVIIGFGVGAALLAGAAADRQRTVRALGLTLLGIALTWVAVMSLHARPVLPPVLAKFNAVQRAALARWDDAARRGKAGELKDPDAADILEREVIAPYKQIRLELLATPDIPERLRPLFQRLDDSVAARIVSLEMLVAALRESDPEKQESLFDTYQHHEPERTRLLSAYTAELRRLGD